MRTVPKIFETVPTLAFRAALMILSDGNPKGISGVSSFKVVSQGEVGLKLFSAAVKRLLQDCAQDNGNIWETFGNACIHCVGPSLAIFKIDFPFVRRKDRPIVRKDNGAG